VIPVRFVEEAQDELLGQIGWYEEIQESQKFRRGLATASGSRSKWGLL
jgi:hypothetical protein